MNIIIAGSERGFVTLALNGTQVVCRIHAAFGCHLLTAEGSPAEILSAYEESVRHIVGMVGGRETDLPISGVVGIVKGIGAKNAPMPHPFPNGAVASETERLVAGNLATCALRFAKYRVDYLTEQVISAILDIIEGMSACDILDIDWDMVLSDALVIAVAQYRAIGIGEAA